jgi:4-hydroxy-tetrahydrodipicolinate reductase
MRIALIGYGKMGQTVERLARDQGHTISKIMDINDNPAGSGFWGDWVENTDVLIDFSLAPAVPSNIRHAVNAQLPIVVGATGWYEYVDKLREEVESRGGACLYSSNFSLGVQTLFHLVREASKVLARYKDVHPFVVETHHVQKVDAPSGTALTIKRILEESYGRPIPVSSVRAGFFPGKHTVGFDSPVDTLTLEHTARNREGFARGALLAAEWIQGKKGFFTFEQVIFGENHG